MRFELSRLRSGEVLAGAAAVVLLVCLFALPWYGLNSSVASIAQRLGVSTSRTGWDSLTTLRWLILITSLSALALVYLQGTRRAPLEPGAARALRSRSSSICSWPPSAIPAAHSSPM